MEKAECMILGLKGYSDAGLIVTFSVEYLLRMLNDTKKIKSFGEDFYNYSVSRPLIVVEDGLIKDISVPDVNVFYSKSLKTLIVYGFEPNLKWSKFIDDILSLIESFKVKRWYSLGGLIDYVTEPRVSGLTNSENLKNMLSKFGVELVNYTGPCSMYSLILDKLKKVNVEGVSLWGHVPYRNYLVSNHLKIPDTLTAYQLLEKFMSISNIKICLDDVLEECRRFKEKVEMLMVDEILSGRVKEGREFYVT